MEADIEINFTVELYHPPKFDVRVCVSRISIYILLLTLFTSNERTFFFFLHNSSFFSRVLGNDVQISYHKLELTEENNLSFFHSMFKLEQAQ